MLIDIEKETVKRAKASNKASHRSKTRWELNPLDKD